MKKAATSALVVLSSLLCLGIVALCIRGYLVRDYLAFTWRSEYQPSSAPKQPAPPDRAQVFTTATLFSESGMLGLDLVIFERSRSWEQAWELARRPGMQPGIMYWMPPPVGIVLHHHGYGGMNLTVLASPRQRATFYAGPRPRDVVEANSMVLLPQGRRSLTITTTNHLFAIAAWIPLLATAVAPAVALFRWQRRRRQRDQNLCPTCGYDLRATPNRCPECGTASSTSSSTPPDS